MIKLKTRETRGHASDCRSRNRVRKTGRVKVKVHLYGGLGSQRKDPRLEDFDIDDPVTPRISRENIVGNIYQQGTEDRILVDVEGDEFSRAINWSFVFLVLGPWSLHKALTCSERTVEIIVLQIPDSRVVEESVNQMTFVTKHRDCIHFSTRTFEFKIG